MIHFNSIFILIFLLMLNVGSNGQGCSDAGFCSVGILKPLNNDTTAFKNQTVSMMLNNGIGDEGVYVFTPSIQYTNRLNERWNLQARIAGNYANGKLGTATGLGDVILSGSYTFQSKSKWSKSVLLGTKIALSSGNILADKKPLPMVYQSSLGTTDIIAGVTITNSRWILSAGYQQPLTGSNQNTFLPSSYDDSTINNYPPSNELNRKGDVLLRASYNIISKTKLKLNAGFLTIYHLGRDAYKDVSVSNDEISIVGSEGLTLNVTLALNYQISEQFSLGITGGAPLIVRDVRPDGLTRSIVVAPEISFKF